MEIRPVFNALMRNKAGLLLIVLQVAITLAIVCNSVFIILERIEKMDRPSGLDEAGLFTLSSIGFAPGFDLDASVTEDLAALRAMPGVIDATPINAIPLSNGGWGDGLSAQPLRPGAGDEGVEGTAVYMVDEHAIDALGLKLVAGRNFEPTEIGVRTQDDEGAIGSVIVSKEVADRLYPDGDALGKPVYTGLRGQGQVPVTIIGIVERLQQPWINSTNIDNSMLVPQRPLFGNFSRYMVRAEPGRRDEVMKATETMLVELNRGRMVRNLRSLEEVRGTSYRVDRAMTWVLASVIVALLVVTGLGIVGMVSFWVTRRVKQIGTRRALGARRFDIRRYFMVENLIVIAIGVALGVVLTYGFNLWLMNNYDVPRLAWYYLPVGALVLFTLGQVAVLGPAGRAAAVSPAIATRSA